MQNGEREREFEVAMQALFPEWRECAGLAPGRVPQMMSRRGAIGATRQLLGKGGLSPGFIRLRDCGGLKHTLEYLVLKREFGGLFTPDERGIARRRLVENGMPRSDLPDEPYA